jgi:hypothetical protein
MCVFVHSLHSCLSNLAEVCQLLHWSLKPYAHDIVDVALGVLSLELGNNEESVHLRRAAAYLVRACCSMASLAV